MTSGEQWLLDMLHELAHRDARASIRCAFVGRGSDATLRCPAAPSLDHVHRDGDRYPASLKFGTDLGSVLPVAVGGALVGELVVLAGEAPFNSLTERHLALLGAAGNPSLVDAHPDPAVAAAFSGDAGERIALYEVLLGAEDLSDFVARLAVWLRAGLVVQSAALEVLAASDARGRSLAGHCSDRIVLPLGEGNAVGYVISDVGERGAAATRALLGELRPLLGHI